MRTGIIAKKIGMTRVFDKETGKEVPVTVLHIESLTVVSNKTVSIDGYTAVQLGVGDVKVKHLTNAQRGYFKKLNIKPVSKLIEFPVTEENTLKTGDQIIPSHFLEAQCVDISGVSIGKGFAGAMKRHNFGGLRASHGVSVSHRSHGSTGQCQDPGKVFKGKKMAGQMGNRRVTTQNLKVIKVDDKLGIIMIRGAVPGSKGSWVTVKDAVKKKSEGLQYPAGLLKVSSILDEGNVQNET